jgi:hypothetical protein
VINGSGLVSGDASGIEVSCTINSYALTGTLSGLFGAGLTLSATGEPDLVLNSSAQTFSFANKLQSGATWAIAVTQQPDSSLICSPAPATGTVGGTDVSTTVTCTCPSGSTCVANWADWRIPPDEPTNYTDNGDGTVTDNVTGLVWQQTPPSSTFNLNEAIAYCQGLSLGSFSSGWRLPSIVELSSITDYNPTAYAASAVNTTFFPSTNAGTYDSFLWSSSPYVYPGDSSVGPPLLIHADTSGSAGGSSAGGSAGGPDGGSEGTGYYWAVYLNDGGLVGPSVWASSGYARCVW